MLSDEAGMLLYHAADGAALQATAPPRERPLRWLGIQPGGTQLALLISNNHLIVTDSETPLADEPMTLSANARGATWSRDGQTLVITDQDGTLHLWTPGAPRASRLPRRFRGAFQADVRSDGRLVVLDLQQRIRIADPATQQVDRITALLPNGYATFTDGGRLLAATANIDEDLRYLVQQPGGHWKPYTPAAFHKLIGQPLPDGTAQR